jgi:uncharacterized protein YqeY
LAPATADRNRDVAWFALRDYIARMLIDDIKARTLRAMKEKDTVARDVLRLALGEIQMAEERASRKLRDEEAGAILRKLVKSNEETLGLSTEGPAATALRAEIEILNALLPKTLSVAEIESALAEQREAIRAAKNDGQATGLAMKHLKSTGAVFDGTDVAAAIKAIRGAS